MRRLKINVKDLVNGHFYFTFFMNPCTPPKIYLDKLLVMNKPGVRFRPVAPDHLLFTKIYKEKIDTIEKNIALKVKTSRLVSPGLFVKTYLQKFNPIMNWVKKILRKKGNCFSTPLKKIIVIPIENERKIIPIISDKPATAWLKNPIFDNANSSVNTKSWKEK